MKHALQNVKGYIACTFGRGKPETVCTYSRSLQTGFDTFERAKTLSIKVFSLQLREQMAPMATKVIAGAALILSIFATAEVSFEAPRLMQLDFSSFSLLACPCFDLCSRYTCRLHISIGWAGGLGVLKTFDCLVCHTTLGFQA